MKFSYKIKKISLVPDKYGKYIKINMITKYDNEGKFVKHVKLNEDMVNLLSDIVITTEEEPTHEK